MANSIYLARLIGPFMLAVAAGLIVNTTSFRAVAEELLRSPAMMFFSGFIMMPTGLALVLAHNVWTAGWPVLITVIGWLLMIGGAVRVVAPARSAAIGFRLLKWGPLPSIGGAVWLLVGLVLCFFGYVR